jgi:hypothetical protein
MGVIGIVLGVISCDRVGHGLAIGRNGRRLQPTHAENVIRRDGTAGGIG